MAPNQPYPRRRPSFASGKQCCSTFMKEISCDTRIVLPCTGFAMFQVLRNQFVTPCCRRLCAVRRCLPLSGVQVELLRGIGPQKASGLVKLRHDLFFAMIRCSVSFVRQLRQIKSQAHYSAHSGPPGRSDLPYLSNPRTRKTVSKLCKKRVIAYLDTIKKNPR